MCRFTADERCVCWCMLPVDLARRQAPLRRRQWRGLKWCVVPVAPQSQPLSIGEGSESAQASGFRRTRIGGALDGSRRVLLEGLVSGVWGVRHDDTAWRLVTQHCGITRLGGGTPREALYARR